MQQIDSIINKNGNEVLVSVESDDSGKLSMIQCCCSKNKTLFIFRSDKAFSFQDVNALYQEYLQLATGSKDKEVSA